ncbi:hypothetical protein Q5752_001997 [Cryptotrichosporon argae]
MSLIGRFEHLSKRPRSDEARPLLEKVASQVKPIMSKRGWRVGTLAEFLPGNPALLGNNMNRGQRINLRLRPPGDPSTFYEYDQLVLVMLHELTHIEHGPHDTAFYGLLAVLEEEYYELKRKGYSGDGFHSGGRAVSGLRANAYEGRRIGLAAAEKRLAQARVIGKGGVLGGRRDARKIREVVAEAAERRIRDDKACNTQDVGHAKEVEDEVRRAQAESEGIDAVDLEPALTGAHAEPDLTLHTGDGAVEGAGTAASSLLSTAAHKALRPEPKTQSARPAKVGKRSPAPSSRPAQPAKPRSASVPRPPVARIEWACPTCTLLNPPDTLACNACAAPRPPGARTQQAEGWYCDFCGAGPRDTSYWSCAECGWVRQWG